MHTLFAVAGRSAKALAALIFTMMFVSASALAQAGAEVSGEAGLKLPDLSSVTFLGMDGRSLLMIGLVFCAAGLVFGLVIYNQLKNMPVHRSMLEISELPTLKSDEDRDDFGVG